MKLLQVRDRGFSVIGPVYVLGTLGLETPGSTRLDQPDFSVGPVSFPLPHPWRFYSFVITLVCVTWQSTLFARSLGYRKGGFVFFSAP